MNIFEFAEFDPDARAIAILEMLEDITDPFARFVLLSNEFHNALNAGITVGRYDTSGDELAEAEIKEIIGV